MVSTRAMTGGPEFSREIEQIFVIGLNPRNVKTI